MSVRDLYVASVDLHIRMQILLRNLPEAPDCGEDADDEEDSVELEMQDTLVEEGLMEMYLQTDERWWFRTTEAGREALIRYVRGDR